VTDEQIDRKVTSALRKGPLTVSSIVSALPAGTGATSVSDSLERLWDSGQVERVRGETAKLKTPRAKAGALYWMLSDHAREIIDPREHPDAEESASA
jgi:hypothetical protein